MVIGDHFNFFSLAKREKNFILKENSTTRPDEPIEEICADILLRDGALLGGMGPNLGHLRLQSCAGKFICYDNLASWNVY
ncbi:MAG: hypothetical protein HY562_00025 [Ignavibacteriales bacterium]|nr:hypothetical protein [Ignavibacteriales bacterium]